MAYFWLCSDITIGSFRFSGVGEVRVKRSLHSYADTAVIRLPSRCKTGNGKDGVAVERNLADVVKEGDEVTINLGYNDVAAVGDGKTPVIRPNNEGLWTVFRGFVQSLGNGNPTEVVCEGYVRKLRLDVNATVNKGTMTVSQLLNYVKKDRNGASTGIKVVVAEGCDLHLQNVRLNNNNGVELIEAVKRFSERMLNVFFIEPDTLWCGLTYTPYSQGKDVFGLGEVNYRIGYNVPAGHGLRMRTPKQRVQVLFQNTLADGKKVLAESDDKAAKQRHKRIVNRVGDVADMKAMANEAQYQANYTGYEGSLTAFLQPACGPGWVANVSNRLNPGMDGKYLIESTEITFGLRGARINVGLGPQLGFKTT
jgi:hypothetical protein